MAKGIMGLDGINSNEITLEDCVFLYYEGRRVMAGDRMITAIDGINSNEITLEDCVFLYYEGRRVVAEDGMITAILDKEQA